MDVLNLNAIIDNEKYLFIKIVSTVYQSISLYKAAKYSFNKKKITIKNSLLK